ncbi:MAG: PQQ-like beta-propeller repeat protein [Armatimonadetes bacterium]|nr:PQQ-like beta-propeller repeat protein [Armatimonadota bacterium]
MRKVFPVLLAVGLLAALLPGVLSASLRPGEWPDWRGPARDGKSPDRGLLKAWPEGGPKLLWQATGIGSGYSTVTVAGGMVYTSGLANDELRISAFSMNGEPAWSVPFGPECTNRPGARSTPVFDEGRLYIVSGTGRIGCFDAKSGARRWSREMSEFGGKAHAWGYAESPLIYENLVIVTPGGPSCIVALDKKTGEQVWASKGVSMPAHYGSCIAATHAGIPMIIAGTGGGILAVSAKDGSLLWQNDFCAKNTANIPTPVYSDGYVFWANGYRKGGICLKLTAANGSVTAEEAWRTTEMDCQIGGYVVLDGGVYGNHRNGWTCLDLKTGEVKWFARGVGKGQMCYADGMLYLFNEMNGTAGLAAFSPDGLEMRGQFQVAGQGTSWAYPVVTGGRLYLRYDDNLYCFDVKAG